MEAEERFREAGPYWTTRKGTHFDAGKDGNLTLCNFRAEIVRQLIYHEGEKTSTNVVLRGMLNDELLEDIEVTSADFASMAWVNNRWGMKPMIFPIPSAERQLKAAIQAMSNPETTHVFTSTGWSKHNGSDAYVTMTGALQGAATDRDVTVRLPSELKHYELGDNPDDKCEAAVRASLALAALGPPHITLAMLLATYRAALGGSDFALHLAGRTGTFKSEISSLFQSHYGARMDARHLPASWSSTANALEALAYRAADALFVIDDFVPNGTSWQVRQLQKTADQIIRAAGNQAGRSRLTDISNLQTTMYPRGLILSTGEDIPEQQSIRARMMILEMVPGDVKSENLSKAQKLRSNYPIAMTDWIKWLMHPDSQEPRERFKAMAEFYRDQNLKLGHARTPPIVGALLATAELMMEWCAANAYLKADERAIFMSNATEIIQHLAKEQEQYLEASDPVEAFLETIRQLMGSFTAHCKTNRGGVPANAEECGWTVITSNGAMPDYKHNGPRIGWVDAANAVFYLDPATIPLIKKHGGSKLSVSTPTLLKRIKEAGKLTRIDDARQRITVRITLEGAGRQVLAIGIENIFPDAADADDIANGVPENQAEDAYDYSTDDFDDTF